MLSIVRDCKVSTSEARFDLAESLEVFQLQVLGHIQEEYLFRQSGHSYLHFEATSVLGMQRNLVDTKDRLLKCGFSNRRKLFNFRIFFTMDNGLTSCEHTKTQLTTVIWQFLKQYFRFGLGRPSSVDAPQ